MMKTIMRKNRLMGLRWPKHQLLEKAKIIFCHGQTFADQQRIFELDESCAMFGHPKFDAEKKTVLYIHGYMESPSQESVNVIVNAYLKRNDHNVLILDWSSLVDGNLFDAVPNAKLLAIKMSEVVLDWIDEGLDVNQFHIIGFSLGAVLAGMIGRSVIKKSTGESKLVRITALDPTFLMFPAFRTKSVNKNDAEFVDIIHTDKWFYNSPKSTGTVDFWPNGGRSIQQRRNYKHLINSNDRCNYRQSWWYWAESVRSSEHSIFLSVRANSWRSFKKGRIDNSAIIQMGIDCSLDAREGDYFLQTNVCKPFAKGVRGLHYEKIECK